MMAAAMLGIDRLLLLGGGMAAACVSAGCLLLALFVFVGRNPRRR